MAEDTVYNTNYTNPDIIDGNVDESLDSLINDYGKREKEKKYDVVYGVSDYANRSFLAKMNDFFIDRSKISLQEKSYFFYLMAVMLDAGLPLTNVLQILSRRTKNERFRRVINTLAYNVDRGRSLSFAMERFPMVFSEFEIGVVKSGESIGNLDKMLSKLAEQEGRDYELSLKIITSLIYPVTVLFALVAAGGILAFYVVPQLANFFEQSGTEMPYLTQKFVELSAFFVDYWWILAVLFLFGFIILNVYRRADVGQLKWDYYKLKFPIAGDLIKKLILVRFVSLLEILISAGLPISRVMEILTNSMGNEVYKRKINLVRMKIERGDKLSSGMKDAPFLFPETLVQMIGVGEQSASLDHSAAKLISHYEAEVEHAIKRLTSVFEPVVIIIIGLMVAFVGFAILGPVFSMSQVIA